MAHFRLFVLFVGGGGGVDAKTSKADPQVLSQVLPSLSAQTSSRAAPPPRQGLTKDLYV